MAETCIQHGDVAALYYCDGCGERLCGDCIEESHALLLCRLCGERALPLAADQPTSVRELHQERQLSGSYSFKDALFYPFRGTGRSLFFAVLFCLFAIWLMSVTFILGPLAAVCNFVLWLGIVGLQFKIVRSTAEGEDELPDWPDFFDFGTLLQDVATWLAIYMVILLALTYYIASGLIFNLAFLEPSFGPWLGLSITLWLGSAFAVMAYGASGAYSRIRVFYVHAHVQGYWAAGSDALQATNMVFGLGAAVFVSRIVLASTIPVFGAILSNVIGTYWILLFPHLAGIVFRRHNKKMDELYWSEYADYGK